MTLPGWGVGRSAGGSAVLQGIVTSTMSLAQLAHPGPQAVNLTRVGLFHNHDTAQPAGRTGSWRGRFGILGGHHQMVKHRHLAKTMSQKGRVSVLSSPNSWSWAVFDR